MATIVHEPGTETMGMTTGQYEQRIVQLERDLAEERRRKRKVLLVCHADNYIEVFAHKSVVVRIDRMVESRRENEIKAEDVLIDMLPKRWQEVYWPVHLRASIKNTPMKPRAVVDGQTIRALLELERKT